MNMEANAKVKKGMRKVLIFPVIFMILNVSSISFAREVSFTQEDRERLIRVEENQKELEKRLIRVEENQKKLEKRLIRVEENQKELEKRLIRVEENQKELEKRLIRLEDRVSGLEKRLDDVKNSLEKRIDDIKTFMLWGFGILFGGMGILIGFVIWDRRTALQPAINRTKELEEREERVERALKELARRDPKAEEALKSAGLL